MALIESDTFSCGLVTWLEGKKESNGSFLTQEKISKENSKKETSSTMGREF
jgi:hypothetical protein